MKKNRKLLGLLMVAGLFGASAAMAQPGQQPGQGGRPSSGGGPGMEQQGGSPSGMHRGGSPAQGERGTPTGQAPGAASPYAYAPGQLKKGDRLPTAYRDRQYVIDDWRAYQLPRPPRGHRWVGIGGDYLLVTGNGTVVQVESGR